MSKKILFVGHDANRAGAQIVLLNWLKEQKKKGIESYLLLESGGALLTQYQKYAKVWVWKGDRNKGNKILKKLPFFKREERIDDQPTREEVAVIMRDLRKERFDLLIANTVASLTLLRRIQVLRAELACYVHELDFSLSMYASEEDLKFLAEKVNNVLVVSEKVGKVLQKRCKLSSEKVKIFPPMVELFKVSRSKQTDAVRQELNIPSDAKVVLGCGLAEWRKGTDIFVRVARKIIKKEPNVHFIWLGISTNLFSEEIKADCKMFDPEGKIHLVPVKSDAKPYFEMANVFFLSSREDPFPLVMLEAASLGIPIVGFKGTGGIEDFSKDFEKMLVEDLDESEAAKLIKEQLNFSVEKLTEISEKLKKRAKEFDTYSFNKRWEVLEKELV
jgi:glycosyltransferase involved in cell wall biosynthesis